MKQFYCFAARASHGFCLCLFFSFSFFQLNAQPSLVLTSKITGLSKPVDIVNAGDNSNRLFVVQQAGIIKVYDQSLAPLGDFLTVPNTSYDGGERGLLSLAFHPNYASNGFFFVYYTNIDGDIEVDRYHTPSGTPNTADPTSREIVIVIDHRANTNHNGGKLNFGDDGYLYFATGDGGAGGDPPNNAQNGLVLLGKMLRINVTTTATAPFYTIPLDNPFLAPGDNIADEIWSFGLRNPFRWSFDKQTHDMWIGDVGQDLYEEINFRPAGSTGGLNYGWHCFEGTHPYTPAGACTLTSGIYAPPLLDYTHDDATGGRAVIGGYVYRGTLNPAIAGYYIFGDEVSGNVWLLPPAGTAADTIQFTNAAPLISAFGEAENGELYYVSVGNAAANGALYAITATSSTLPVKLISFDGNARSGYNELSWSTADEVQFRQFEIEYSTDAVHFQQAGTVAAGGGGNYHFKHTTAAPKSYYRLRMVDIDGKAVYSKTIIITAAGVQERNFVTPSVISNKMFTVQLAGSFSGLQVINMDGKIVYHTTITNRTGRLTVALNGVPAGQYLVRLYANDRQLVQKIVVQ